MMQTVLIIVNHNITIYNFRKELVEQLISKGYRVIVVLPIIEETKKIVDLGCEVIDVPVERRGTNPIHDAKLFFQYLKIIKEIKPEIVLTYTIKPNVYGGLASSIAGIPYICTITGLGSAIEGGGLLGRLSLFLYKAGLRKVNTIFFQNSSNHDIFENHGISKGRGIVVNGSGVNLKEYQDIPFPAKDKAVEFLFISRIMKTKGIDEFLDMCKYIKNRYEDVKFHILGFCEDDYLEKLKDLEKEEIIQYHGLQEDIRPFMKNTQCLIHPSYHEGMSNVCMEAAACGRVVIASDIPGCRELVWHNESGYLVKPQDTKSLIEAVEFFLQLTYEDKVSMGLFGKKKIEENFSRDKIVQTYMKQIEKICENDKLEESK